MSSKGATGLEVVHEPWAQDHIEPLAKIVLKIIPCSNR